MTKTLYSKIKPLLAVRGPKKLYFYSLLVGLFSGFAAILFTYLLAFSQSFFFEFLADKSLSGPAHSYQFHWPWQRFPLPFLLFPLLPALGAFLGGLFVYKWAPEAEGHGTDAMIDAFHNKEGNIRAPVPFIKALATLLTLGSGGSAGKEGPIAQIGAGFGSLFARFCSLGPKAKRTLLLAGTSGGLAAIFHAPLGGALTAIEVIYKEDFESEALIPSVLSAGAAFIVYSMHFGFHHLFEIGEFHFSDVRELIFYLILAFACVFFGKFYVKIFYFFTEKIFRPLSIPKIFKPLIGGLFVGIVGLFFPQAIGSGFGFLQDMFLLRIDMNFWPLILLLAALIPLRILTTSLTIGSGGSGGVFGPSLLIGATIGALVGMLAKYYFPSIVDSPVPYMVVGMSAFFAGVANAPVASIMMVCELTGSYELLPPLMLVSVVAIIFSGKSGIYKKQLENKFKSPAHLWDMNVDILKSIRIEDIQPLEKKAIFTEETPLADLIDESRVLRMRDFVIIDDKEHYLGIAKLTSDMEETTLPLIAHDLCDHHVASIRPRDNLTLAVEHMLSEKTEIIAVVDKKKVVGILEYKQILNIYKEQVNGFINKRRSA